MIHKIDDDGYLSNLRYNDLDNKVLIHFGRTFDKFSQVLKSLCECCMLRENKIMLAQC